MGSATITDPVGGGPSAALTNDINITDVMLTNMEYSNISEDNSAVTITRYFTRETLQSKIWGGKGYSILIASGGGNPHSASPDHSSTATTAALHNLITFKVWAALTLVEFSVQANEIGSGGSDLSGSKYWRFRLYTGNNRTSGATWTQLGNDMVLSNPAAPLQYMTWSGSTPVWDGDQLFRLYAEQTVSPNHPICDFEVRLKFKADHVTP